MRKKVAVLECQLRKSEAAKKSFEMSTLKLLSFVEVMSHSDGHQVEGFSLFTKVTGKKKEQEVSARVALNYKKRMTQRTSRTIGGALKKVALFWDTQLQRFM